MGEEEQEEEEVWILVPLRRPPPPNRARGPAGDPAADLRERRVDAGIGGREQRRSRDMGAALL